MWILLFVIIGTSLIMTAAMIYDKKRAATAVKIANQNKVGSVAWKAPTIEDVTED